MRQIIPGLQAFEFVTNASRRLALSGTLLSWQDEHTPGIAEHQILRRKGALHQDMGSGPMRCTFRCTLLGAQVGERYKALAAAIDEDPIGRLIHPRFGHMPAVCTKIQAAEDPAQAVDEILFTIAFSETGLRTAARDSPGNIAAGALLAATTLSKSAPKAFSVRIAALVGALNSFVSMIATANANNWRTIELTRLLGTVGVAAQQIQALARDRGTTEQGAYEVYSGAALAHARAIDAYNAALAQRPPIILYTVEAQISLTALAQRLYGGRLAKDMAAEILQQNRILRPHRIPAGTQLLLASPEVVTRAR